MFSHAFLLMMLTPRFSRKTMVLLALVNVLVAEGLCELVPNTFVLRPLLVPLMVLIFILLVYRDRWSTCVLLALCYGILETVAYLLFYPGQVLEGVERLETFRHYFCWVPLLLSTILLLWLVFLGLRMLQARMGLREVLTYAAIPVSQFFLFIGWEQQLAYSENTVSWIVMLVVVVLCVITDILVFILMFRSSYRQELETTNRILSYQVDAQLAHYAGLTEQYSGIRRMRHDIIKHVDAIEELLASGQNEEAVAYTAELRASAYDTTLGFCEHPAVDAYIHRAIQAPLQDGVNMDVSLSIPADISISAVDLVCSFGNLIDNAAEACAGNPDAFIRLRAHTAAGYLLISMENSVSTVKTKKVRIPGLDRGVGLKVIENIARKYDGYFKYYVMGDVFRAEISYRLDV